MQAEEAGVEGLADSAVIAACLRFVPVVSVMVGVIGVKGGSEGGDMIATGASSEAGKSVAEKGATAEETTDSFGLAFETANSRDLDGRRCGCVAGSGRYAEGGDGGVVAGRPRVDAEVLLAGKRDAIGAAGTF